MLVHTLAPLLLNTCMAVFYLLVMLNQNIPPTLIGLTALVLNVSVSAFVTKRRINITRVQMRDQAKLESTKASGIAMIETIKSCGGGGERLLPKVGRLPGVRKHPGR